MKKASFIQKKTLLGTYYQNLINLIVIYTSSNMPILYSILHSIGIPTYYLQHPKSLMCNQTIYIYNIVHYILNSLNLKIYLLQSKHFLVL